MVILRKYTLLLPAQLAKLELASYGIEAVILDEAVGSLAPCFTMGSIRLAVADEDEEEANSLLIAMKERNSASGGTDVEDPKSL